MNTIDPMTAVRQAAIALDELHSNPCKCEGGVASCIDRDDDPRYVEQLDYREAVEVGGPADEY